MQSTSVKVTQDLLPGPVADAASPILSLAAALHPLHSVVSEAVPAISDVCATPGHPLDPSPKWQNMVTSGTAINQDPNTEEEGTNIKVRRVRKIPVIVIQIIQKHKEQQKNLHHIPSALMTTHLDIKTLTNMVIQTFTSSFQEKVMVAAVEIKVDDDTDRCPSPDTLQKHVSRKPNWSWAPQSQYPPFSKHYVRVLHGWYPVNAWYRYSQRCTLKDL